MEQKLILIPMFVLVFYTFFVLISIPVTRFHAVYKRRVHPKYFKLNSGYDVPDYIVRVNQHLENLMHTPMLFYVVCILFYITNQVSETALVLAWVYIGARGVHGFIHLFINHILFRLSAFATSAVILAVMWIHLFIAL